MMKQVIDEIKTMPGVVGCCIYSSVNGVHISNLPVVFTSEHLAAIGEQLFSRLSADNNSMRDPNKIIRFNYGKSVIVARRLNNNLLLFIICAPSLNQNLLVMSMNLMLQEVFEDSQNDPVLSMTTQQPSTEDASAKPSQFQLDERLLTLISEIRSLLGKILGPMAGYVFDETFSDWQKQGNTDFDDIGVLIDMLNREIVDSDKIEHFQNLIASKLDNFRKG
jgi:hypothetical protein